MNILCIGNSFSVDVSTYVHQIAKSAGRDINIYVLYIGGCPIDAHYRNLQSGEKLYEFYENGAKQPLMICSIQDGLNYKKWDYITFQQVSTNSGNYDSFFPELPLLMDGVRKFSDAQFIFHMTWSYAKGHSHAKYGENPLDQDWMNRDIFETYEKISKTMNIPYIIPSGKAVKKAREVFGDNLNRDNFHLNELGRTLTGIVLAYFFLGLDIDVTNFLPEGYSYDDVTAGVNKQDYLKLVDIAKKTILENKTHNLCK